MDNKLPTAQESRGQAASEEGIAFVLCSLGEQELAPVLNRHGRYQFPRDMLFHRVVDRQRFLVRHVCMCVCMYVYTQ